MKLRFPSDTKQLKRTALYTLVLFFCAHAFCFFNLTYSGASVMLDVSRTRAAQIAAGQFLAPYYFRLRGTLSAPLWVGMLCAVYLTLTTAVSARLLRLKKPAHLFVLCGTMTANAALTALFAASLHTADAALLALLLGALSALCCLRMRFGFVPGAMLLCAALALDPSALAIFAALSLLAWLCDLLHGAGRKALALAAVRVILCALAGAAVWGLGCLLMAYRSGIALSIAPRMPEGGIFAAYLAPIRAMTAPLTAYAKLSVVLRALLALACAAALVMNARRLGAKRAALAVLAVLLAPLVCALPLFYQAQAAQITCAYCLLDALLLALLAHLTDDRPRVPAALCAVFFPLFLGSIVFSNQVYLKKNLEFESTLSLTSRIIQRAEETEGYHPGFTPVAIIGTPEESAFSVARKGFEHLAALDAAKANYAVTSEDQMIWYCWEVLGYPSNFVSSFELSELKEHDAVKAMPLFPAEGCCQMVGGVLVIRLN